MTDLTPFFQKCIAIYEDELKTKTPETQRISKPKPKSATNTRQSKLTANNTFVAESIKLNSLIEELKNLISEIQKDYLLANSKNMSEFQKDKIDSTFKLQLSLINKKLESLKTYAEALNKQLENNLSVEDIGKNLLTMGDYGQYVAILNSSISEIRSNIIKALGLRITSISNQFIEINTKRMERKKEFNKSSLNTSNYYSYTPMEINSSNENSNSVALEDGAKGEVSSEFNQLNESLGEQQLQQLSKENENILLELKNSNLESITQIENSMVEISTVINEINLHINLQNDSITMLDNNQDDILGNMSLGNKQLRKANERTKNSGRNLSILILCLAMLLLLADYIL